MHRPRRGAMNELSHFAINADDVDRARRFYGAVFGWTFEPFGPPGFFRIQTARGEAPGPLGALQQRRELVPGRTMTGFECTIAVADVGAAARAVTAAGGRIVMDRTVIAGVGELFFFEDPEGNVLKLMCPQDIA
ncbi:MAG: glyoxalase [Gammaproteobacteria bacterium]|nr:glyoxalase [Gammaproteobacteria bacterium]